MQKEKDCEDGQPKQKSEPISPVPAISFVLKLHEQEARRPRAARLQKKLLSAFGPLGTKMLFLVSQRLLQAHLQPPKGSSVASVHWGKV